MSRNKHTSATEWDWENWEESRGCWLRYAPKCKYMDDDHVVQFVASIIFIITQVLTTRQEANNSCTLFVFIECCRPTPFWTLRDDSAKIVLILRLHWPVNYKNTVSQNATRRRVIIRPDKSCDVLRLLLIKRCIDETSLFLLLIVPSFLSQH